MIDYKEMIKNANAEYERWRSVRDLLVEAQNTLDGYEEIAAAEQEAADDVCQWPDTEEIVDVRQPKTIYDHICPSSNIKISKEPDLRWAIPVIKKLIADIENEITDQVWWPTGMILTTSPQALSIHKVSEICKKFAEEHEGYGPI